MQNHEATASIFFQFYWEIILESHCSAASEPAVQCSAVQWLECMRSVEEYQEKHGIWALIAVRTELAEAARRGSSYADT